MECAEACKKTMMSYRDSQGQLVRKPYLALLSLYSGVSLANLLLLMREYSKLFFTWAIISADHNVTAEYDLASLSFFDLF